MDFIIHVIIVGVAVAIGAYILPGVTVRNILTALWVAFLLAIINATIGKILHFLTMPFNWLTLGLVGFVINVLMIMLVDKIVPGFTIKNFFWAILFAIILSIVSGILHWVF